MAVLKKNIEPSCRPMSDYESLKTGSVLEIEGVPFLLTRSPVSTKEVRVALFSLENGNVFNSSSPFANMGPNEIAVSELISKGVLGGYSFPDLKNIKVIKAL